MFIDPPRAGGPSGLPTTLLRLHEVHLGREASAQHRSAPTTLDDRILRAERDPLVQDVGGRRPFVLARGTEGFRLVTLSQGLTVGCHRTSSPAQPLSAHQGITRTISGRDPPGWRGEDGRSRDAFTKDARRQCGTAMSADAPGGDGPSPLLAAIGGGTRGACRSKRESWKR